MPAFRALCAESIAAFYLRSLDAIDETRNLMTVDVL